ncbi:MAG TPA: hypothetical protein VNA17_11860 [Pyrinomonadaceae bacterium]|nr:hypothetical protein [Pyrinomonadaceae bacterium]
MQTHVHGLLRIDFLTAIDDFCDYSFDLLSRNVLTALPQNQVGHLSLVIFDECDFNGGRGGEKHGFDSLGMNFLLIIITVHLVFW